MSRVKHILLLILFCVVQNPSHSYPRHSHVSVVYSADCKACLNFIHHQLLPTFKKISQHVYLQLNPNGKPQEAENQNKLDRGGRIQRCVLKEKLETLQHLKFLDCFMTIRSYQICASNNGFNLINIMDCIKHTERKPEIDVGNLPQIKFNGQVDKELENRAKIDFFALICELNKYPPACHKKERKKKRIKREDRIGKCYTAIRNRPKSISKKAVINKTDKKHHKNQEPKVTGTEIEIIIEHSKPNKGEAKSNRHKGDKEKKVVSNKEYRNELDKPMEEEKENNIELSNGEKKKENTNELPGNSNENGKEEADTEVPGIPNREDDKDEDKEGEESKEGEEDKEEAEESKEEESTEEESTVEESTEEEEKKTRRKRNNRRRHKFYQNSECKEVDIGRHGTQVS